MTQNSKPVAENTETVLKEVAEQATQVLENSTNDALSFLGIPIDVNALTSSSVDIALRVLVALLIFFIGKWIGSRLVNFAKMMMTRSRLDNTAANFLGNLLYGVMLAAVVLAALNKLGVNTNSFVAILGAAGVAIGISLKDQLSNLAAGLLIVIFRPFSKGDVVEIGGKTGVVLDITLVNTRIRSAHNHEIIIPNGDIMTNASTNFSSLPTRRVDIDVGISYQASIAHAKQVMIDVAKKHPLVLAEPKPEVFVMALADSSVNLSLRVWAENEHWLTVQSDLLEMVKDAFDQEHIGIPYPNRTVQIEGLSQLSKRLES